MLLVPLVLVLAGIETALILLLRFALTHSITWPLTLIGVLAGVLLIAGVSCELFCIHRTQSVRGVSFLFCGIDALGDVTSAISVMLQRPRDYVALGVYVGEYVAWCAVFACGVWFGLVPWGCRRWAVVRKVAGNWACCRGLDGAREGGMQEGEGRIGEQGAEGQDERQDGGDDVPSPSMSVFRMASHGTVDSIRRRPPRQADLTGTA